MAEIPIEKKSGMNWLWLLLAAIVLALLAWWLLSKDKMDAADARNDQVAADSMADPNNPDMMADGTMADGTMADGTDAAMAAGTATAMTVGQPVKLENVRVTTLEGDMAFNVDANGQKAFVVFDETPGRIKETQFDIDPGMVIDIEGDVHAASDPMPAGIKATVPKGVDQYIVARKLSPRK